jgi:N-acetylneuraminate synthase
MIKASFDNIKQGCRPFIVAEISGNHDGSIERAKKLIDVAHQAGVDAVKLQTFTADTITLDVKTDEFWVSDQDNLWQGQSLHQLYQRAATPWEWHQELFDYCHSKDLLCFSSPFDESAVDFLETIDCPAYKIASFELVHIPLIQHAAKTGKPLIMSTGMASEQEIREAVDAAHQAGAKQVVLLKCTSAYPAKITDANLATISNMRDKYQCPIGLSDHSLGIDVPIVATALGAVLIEKHITLDRDDGAVDSAFSLQPNELKALVKSVHSAWSTLGKVTYGGSQSEEKSKIYRRSIYANQAIKEGDYFSKENLSVVRPGLGLSPKYLSNIIGKKATTDISTNTALAWHQIETEQQKP